VTPQSALALAISAQAFMARGSGGMRKTCRTCVQRGIGAYAALVAVPTVDRC
jgi:hypothetical protein